MRRDHVLRLPRPTNGVDLLVNGRASQESVMKVTPRRPIVVPNGVNLVNPC